MTKKNSYDDLMNRLDMGPAPGEVLDEMYDDAIRELSDLPFYEGDEDGDDETD